MPKAKEKFETLLEEIRSDVKLSLEGHDTLRSEMRQMEGRLTEKIEENESAIKFVAKQLGDKIDNVDKKLDVHMRQPTNA